MDKHSKKSSSLLHYPVPVSYTHLDVYKRQMLYNNIMLQSYGTLARVYDSTGTPAMPSTHSTAPVSYTHLPCARAGGSALLRIK